MSDHPEPFREIAILGPGLLGTSLALALQETAHVRLWGRRPDSLAEARERGYSSLASNKLDDAVTGADLVIFCMPIDAMPAIARSVAPLISASSVVTDVGSVKAPVVAELEPIFGPERFLGSHPMAGSEQSGAAAARGDLFRGAVCILTPTEKTPDDLRQRVARFWENLSCEIHELTADLHDRRIALISHLPHLLAASLVNTVAGAEPDALRLAGQGFRDSTRIASGPPEMWRGILSGNKTHLLAALAALRDRIGEAEDMLNTDDDAGLRNFLTTAKTNRDGIIRKVRYGGD